MRGCTVYIPLVLLLLAPTDTFATTQCSVKKTSDGFVALRKGASATAPLILRLRTTDVILISSEREPSGKWLYVSVVKHGGGFGPSGWLNGRLIDNDKCG